MPSTEPLPPHAARARREGRHRIYLSARYSRREEMLRFAEQVRKLGHEVTSRWIAGEHQCSEEDLLGDDLSLAIRFASEDWDDIEESTLVFAFTEEPRSAPNGGGRHCEVGIALAVGIPVVVVGPRENAFHALCDQRFSDAAEALSWLGVAGQ